MRRLALVILLFVCTITVAAASTAPPPVHKPAVLRRDTSAVAVKQLNSSALSKYAADDEFKYIKGKAASISWWQQFWAWLWYWIGTLMQKTGISGSVMLYIIIGVGVAALLYVILNAAGMDISFLFRRNARKASLPYYESIENIHEIDFDTEIENAANQHNYRLAVRLLYLKCLKQLSDAGLIEWQIDKTNTAYLHELSDPLQREAFGSLTRRFEYVWYGDFAIDEKLFNNINLLFQHFKPGRK